MANCYQFERNLRIAQLEIKIKPSSRGKTAPETWLSDLTHSIPTIGAELLLWKSYRFNHIGEGLVFERGQVESLPDSFNHGGVFLRGWIGILREVHVLRTLQLSDGTSSGEIQLGFGA